MLGIGDFARYGRVSVRMLRHYDALGLMRPAHIDDSTGYRYYEPAQLARLNRIVALKDLGFTLQQVGEILEDRLTADELRGMLRLRRAELEQSIAADRTRLAGVESRLAGIEQEGHLPRDEVVVKAIAPVRVAEVTGTARTFAPADIGPVLRPLFSDLTGRLAQAGVPAVGPALAYYDDGPRAGVAVHAALPVNAGPADPAAIDVDVVDLPAIPRAATVVHRGPMDRVIPTTQALAGWIDVHGYRSAGYHREVYLSYGVGDPSEWATELQEPIAPHR
ncbi:MerR family transcriptional regulator [Georgenia deserti]|uniref:MerR family transcriptional regulator n=1 Tax=Georgenia deserti TaxID=2093781 RepID=A0ABW4L5D4_9MICO